MKFFIIFAVLAQVLYSQNAEAQVINPFGCGCGGGQILAAPALNPVLSAPVVTSYPAAYAQSNVAGSLADTLSLLTVSNLLAQKLPLNPCGCGVPIGCGCGYNGYNNYGYVF